MSLWKFEENPYFKYKKDCMCCRSVAKQSKAIVHSEPLNIKAKSPDLTLSNRVVVILPPSPHPLVLRYERMGGWSGATGLNEVTSRDNFKAKMAGTSEREREIIA
jgi:hypothetical protein